MTRWLCCAVGLWCVMVAGSQAQTQAEPQKPTAQGISSSVEEAAKPQESKPTQEVESVPAAVARQRQDLNAQREAIMVRYAQQQVACWQKFAVNACLTEARRIRRQTLEPIRQQELVLNAQERAWRTAEREQRMLDKQPAPENKP